MLPHRRHLLGPVDILLLCGRDDPLWQKLLQERGGLHRRKPGPLRVSIGHHLVREGGQPHLLWRRQVVRLRPVYSGIDVGDRFDVCERYDINQHLIDDLDHGWVPRGALRRHDLLS